MKTLPCHLLIPATALAGLVSSPSAQAAATVAVGACHASTPSYPTIQQAVNAVSFGGTVLVCAGPPYAEQVIISQPLTLKGIAVGKQQIPRDLHPHERLSGQLCQPESRRHRGPHLRAKCRSCHHQQH